eukprot:XP_003728707.1 PREDICTED: methylcrotonoyl-CoA carboxylase beta chain, mitochondrial [Strongylocentrotus purpuratus]
MSYGELCSISEAINQNQEGRADQATSGMLQGPGIPEARILQNVLQLCDQDIADRLDTSQPLTAYELVKIWKEKPRQSFFNYRAALAHELQRIHMTGRADEIAAGKYMKKRTSLVFIEDMVQGLTQDQLGCLGELLKLSGTPSDTISKEICIWVAEWTTETEIYRKSRPREERVKRGGTLTVPGGALLARMTESTKESQLSESNMPHDHRDLNDRLILARLVDGSRFHEFKKLYGPTLITGFAFVRGHLVGITANDGELSHDAATKGAHFAELCQHRNIPLIFLQSVSEDESWAKGDHELMGETIKARAKMAAVVACMTVPKITVMVGSSYGSSSFAMCSSSFDPRFVFMWPNARVGLQHPEEMATLAAQESGKPEDEEKLREKFQKQSTAVFASSRMWNDGVIAPEDTRNVLSQCLSIVSQQACNQPFAYQNRAVLRM